MRYFVDIDKVVLHGLPRVDTRRLSNAFAREVERLIGRDSPNTHAVRQERMQAHTIELSSSDPRELGRKLARSVVGALRR